MAELTDWPIELTKDHEARLFLSREYPNRVAVQTLVSWPPSEEGPRLLAWDRLSSRSISRWHVAEQFAREVQAIASVEEIWLTESLGDLEMVAVTPGMDLEAETAIRRVFIDAVCEYLDPSEGELHVFPTDEVPDWVFEGTKIP